MIENSVVDLRSDTVTHPTPIMREAMAHAAVGDDVFGDDPTVNRLESLAASKMGKEAAVFVPSGTMGNLAAVFAHCGRGDEVITGNLGHTFLFEAGGIAALGGVHPHTIPNQKDGTLRLEDIAHAIRPDDEHFPITRLIILENTHNRCGGVVLSPEYMRQVGQLAHEQGLFLHLDGARIFNAAVALGIPAAELAAPVDSVTFCLSKGLCAPVGSVLCGSKDFIRRARRMRKQLGGSLRQSGILAAAGIIALEQMVDRLAEDHRRAKMLAIGLSTIPGCVVDTIDPATNMVFLNLDNWVEKNAAEIARLLQDYNVKVMDSGPRRFRLVTHYWIDDQDVEQTVNAFRQVLRG